MSHIAVKIVRKQYLNLGNGDNSVIMNVKLFWNILLFFLCVWIRRTETACGGSDNTGMSNVDLDDDGKNDNNQDTGFLMYHSTYKFGCCGRLKQWKFFVQSKYGSINLQVWRYSGSTWTLVGENAHTVSSGSSEFIETVNVATSDQILVQSGDYIGWYSSGDNPVGYENNGKTYKKSTLTAIKNPGVGNTADWDSVTSSNREFAIQATVDGNNKPSFSAVGTQTLADTDPISTSITNIAATDSDTADVLTYSMTSSSPYFEFDTGTNDLKTKAALQSGSYNLSFKVSDDCGNEDTLTVTVVVTNSAPSITNLPGAADVREDSQDETLLLTLSVTDQSPVSSVTCTVTSSSPVSNDFFIKPISGTNDNGIYIQASPTLDYTSIKTYTLSVTCSDGTDSVSGSFVVSIVQNSPPSFDNLRNSTSIASAATSVGDVIFKVLTTDIDNDQLFYNMTCSEATCPFQIYNNGEVLCTTSIAGTTLSDYDLSIYVYDTYSLIGPEVLSIAITDINNAPVITNLPLASNKLVSENSALGMSIFTVAVTDPDSGQTHSYSASFTPGSASSLFTVHSSTGEVTTSSTKNINYEALTSPTVTIAITVSDGTATDTENLVITIVNVNEAPSFQKSVYAISGNEGNTGTSFGNPGFIILDEDPGDVHTYSINCPTFSMDLSTADVKLAVPYDLDTAGTPSSLTCLATVKDTEYSATATLSITVNYANDNSPQFTLYSYTFYVSSATAIGFNIGQLNAADADAGDDGIFYYSLVQSNLNTTYFGINSNGEIYVKHSIADFGNGGRTLVISAVVTDNGGRTDTAAVSLIIPATTTLATTTTTDRYIEFIEDPKNVAWIVCISTFGLIFVGVAIFTGYRQEIFVRWFKNIERCFQNCHERMNRSGHDSNLEEYEDDDAEIEEDAYYRKPANVPEKQQRFVTIGNTGKGETWDFWGNSSQL